MGLSEVYTEEIHDHLHPYYANWEPGEPMKLGDYGTMDGDIFIREGNIKSFKITFETLADDTADQKKFSSEGTTETEVGIGGSGEAGVASVKAGLEIKFSSKDSVFFNAAECTTESIDDKTALGNQLMELYQQKKWKKKWAVVTEIVKAGATTVAISLEDNAHITFEGTADVQKIDLADAKIGLKVGSSSKVGYTVEAAKGMIPLMKLYRIQSTGFLGLGGDELQPMLAPRPGGEEREGEKRKAEVAFREI